MDGRSIYALVDPRTMALRYVGATRNALVKRVRQHLAPEKLARKTLLAAWLRELVAYGLRPYIMLIEHVAAYADWREAEKQRISELRAQGHDLTNDHEGGTGPDGGWGWGKESRARLSAAMAGKSRGGTSQFPGVSFRRRDGRWVAQCCKRYLGLFDSEEDAFEAYQRAYRQLFDAPVPGFTSD